MISPRLVLYVLCLLTAPVGASDDPIDAVKKGQPKDVVLFIDRYVDCAHWGGEEGYDAERRDEIHAAVTKLRCLTLDSDEKALLKKYSGIPSALKAIRKAKELYY